MLELTSASEVLILHGRCLLQFGELVQPLELIHAGGHGLVACAQARTIGPIEAVGFAGKA